jgi:hypothetical protein
VKAQRVYIAVPALPGILEANLNNIRFGARFGNIMKPVIGVEFAAGTEVIVELVPYIVVFFSAFSLTASPVYQFVHRSGIIRDWMQDQPPQPGIYFSSIITKVGKNFTIAAVS